MRRRAARSLLGWVLGLLFLTIGAVHLATGKTVYGIYEELLGCACIGAQLWTAPKDGGRLGPKGMFLLFFGGLGVACASAFVASVTGLTRSDPVGDVLTLVVALGCIWFIAKVTRSERWTNMD
jgi:hypothetical protein